ncbi:transposase [Clostridium senegalense]|uniref:transposase n=1 Tax=Clostridium senegalense TaxID=1465809 RepID=UPI000288CDB5|nr:transposase [Clostridium senegalense]
MPRGNRQLSDFGIYHIVVKSPSNLTLFKNSIDKINYLRIIRFYQKIFHFKIYSYCIMDNHAHFTIDVGKENLSNIMKKIKEKYSFYFRNSYNFSGSIFNNRFYSSIINSDTYLIQVTNYIHLNPASINSFKNKPEEYPFSSLGIYIKERKDYMNLIDCSRVLQYFSKDLKTATYIYKQNILAPPNKRRFKIE